PNFYHLEQKYGSVMGGLQATIPSASANRGKSQGIFFSFKNGLETLITQLQSKLPEHTVYLNVKVKRLEKQKQGYHISLNNGEQLDAAAAIIATQHDAVPKILPQYDFVKELSK